MEFVALLRFNRTAPADGVIFLRYFPEGTKTDVETIRVRDPEEPMRVIEAIIACA